MFINNREDGLFCDSLTIKVTLRVFVDPKLWEKFVLHIDSKNIQLFCPQTWQNGFLPIGLSFLDIIKTFGGFNSFA